MTMTALGGGNDLTASDIQRCKKRGSAMTLVSMRHAFDITQSNREHRLRSIQGLNLALFVHTQNHCVIVRVQVQPDDIAYFLDEKRICGKLKMTLPVGLKPERTPDTIDRRCRDTHLLGHGANRPMGTVLGLCMQRLTHHGSYLLVGNRVRSPRSELIMQALDSIGDVALAP